MKFKFIFFLVFVTAKIIFTQSTTVFVKYKSEIASAQIDSLISSKQIFSYNFNSSVQNMNYDVERLHSLVEINEFGIDRIIKINFKDGISSQALSALQQNNLYEYVQLGTVYKIHASPNDSLYNQQWGLIKIKAPQAWEVAEGEDSIIVCIIDTGIDYLHPDLASSIFINNGETGADALGGEKRSNGIDDDLNGFVDDWRGFDFTDRQGFPFDSTGGDYLFWDNNPMDENGFSHGTAVAGIIAATKNNSIGIAGVSPKVKLLNLRAFDPAGYGEEDDVAAAIIYAVNNGAKVINMSFGDNSFSLVLRDVIRYAYSKGVILVGSSGNSSSANPHYPSGYQEVISVGNSMENDAVASSSNFGSTLDLVAPGTGIITTVRNNRYGSFTGTSAAAPFVTASAALIKSISNFSNEEVKQILKSTCDEIGATGWDLKSGAGRLNLHRAITVLAPSIIKFDYPFQDFATSNDSLKISATILSPYFKSYSLMYGIGLNPQTWNTLVDQSLNQFAHKEIFNLDLSGIADTSLTLRLIIYQINGSTLEERINFHLIKTPPQVELISLFPALYGDKSSVMSAVYTSQRSVVKMYYRKQSTTTWNYVTLDGFTTNNQFVKTLHYGFIPKNLAEFNAAYEIYFEAVNLAGISSLLKDGSAYFLINTGPNFSIGNFEKMNYKLPAGNIFEQSLSLKSSNLSEVALRENNSPTITRFYKLQNGNFILSDSLSEKIVKDFGDFNDNGKNDLLTFWSYNSYIYENTSGALLQKYKKEGGINWPVGVKDYNGDGTKDIMMVVNDSTISISKINADLSFAAIDSLKNFSTSGFGGDYFDYPNAILFDSDNDGSREIWIIDTDGDLMNFKNISGKFHNGKVYRTDFISSMSYIATGDFNGNGLPDIAILLHSYDKIDIASFHLLKVLEFRNGEPVEIFSKAFIDPAVEFNSAFQKIGNALRLVDIDADGSDELILVAFPYSYIFKNNSSSADIIFYEENVNSSSLFVGDLNQNGIPEFALPGNLEINFYEYGGGLKTNTPFQLNGFSVDSLKIKLTWLGSGQKYFIYRGENELNLNLIDSSSTTAYYDSIITMNTKYYYAIQAYNSNKSIPLSNLSKALMVRHHKPAQLKNVEILSNNSVKISFDEKINPTIDRINSFVLNDSLFNQKIPNSVSPFDEFSYFISFSSNFNNGKYWIKINQLKDLFGSPIGTDSVSFVFAGSSAAAQFYVESFSILDPYNIKIKFNMPLDKTIASDKNNYQFSPSNLVNSISFDSGSSSELKINLFGGKPIGATGIIYTLKIKNLKSDLASGGVTINDGAGSNLVLSSVAENLDGIYFYPSPALIKNGYVTFANVPQNVEISIWTIEGKKIVTIAEKDNDGGMRWNYKDEEGREVNSGIYIFRAVKLSDLNEELELKIGKIAIIK